jgi:hydrogenase maturation protein HypF
MSVTVQAIVACRITLHGQVQGVGLRPAIARLADELHLAGTVANSSAGVVVHVEGSAEQIEMFQSRLTQTGRASGQLSIADVQLCEPAGLSGFHIVDSLVDGPLTTRVPPDRATCDACFAEVSTDQNRRSGYEFTSCTDCGPRYSIIDAMPYDRCRTSMRPFELCGPCVDEYRSPDDRRFHSQTNACPLCGPACTSDANSLTTELAARAVLDGKILALKGLGGYQLIVDATNSEAIDRLRQRKQRPARPLAVMVQTLSDAEALAELSELERTVISGPERPIVLARARPASAYSTLCQSAIHPDLNELGLFLPTTPQHWLLLQRVGRPLIVTSGNLDGDPLAATHADANQTLSGVADVWLHHNRDIVRPIDDSVVRVIANRALTIRNARGLAPLSLPAIERFTRKCAAKTGDVLPPVLAAGGHQKSAVALFNGHQAMLGPHIGDLNSLATRQRFVEHVEQLQTLYRFQPQLIVHDSHPDYFSNQWAESTNTRTLAVQHHHAHVVSGLVQHDWLDREVLGVAFDGTGDGTDGTVWGGEFLHATVHGFKRVAHLRPIRLPGGETAIREPWRVGVSLLLASAGHKSVATFARTWNQTINTKSVLSLASSQLAPETTSVGRLFDGVASLILGIVDSEFDGQPAMLLESAADPSVTGAYDLLIDGPGDAFSVLGSNRRERSSAAVRMQKSAPAQLDWRPMIRHILQDVQDGCAVSVIAAKFHRGLARGVAAMCRRFNLPVVLTGGVFQNRLLTEWVIEELKSSECEVACHSTIPPNDGGLAAGQLAIALARLSHQCKEF